MIEVAFIEFEGVTEAAVMLGYDVEFTELVGEPDGSVALVTLGSIPPVGVGVVMLMFDTDILGGESLRAPNIACWVTAFFSYMLSRLPAPQYVCLSPAQSMLHCVMATLVDPVLIFDPQ